jgi:hypothetical protein
MTGEELHCASTCTFTVLVPAINQPNTLTLAERRSAVRRYLEHIEVCKHTSKPIKAWAAEKRTQSDFMVRVGMASKPVRVIEVMELPDMTTSA